MFCAKNCSFSRSSRSHQNIIVINIEMGVARVPAEDLACGWNPSRLRQHSSNGALGKSPPTKNMGFQFLFNKSRIDSFMVQYYAGPPWISCLVVLNMIPSWQDFICMGLKLFSQSYPSELFCDVYLVNVIPWMVCMVMRGAVCR